MRDVPTAAEVTEWYKKSKLPLDRFYNKNGKLFKEHKYTEQFKTMSEKDIIEKLSSEGGMLKRPILVTDDKVLVGWKKDEWEKELLG